MKFARKSLVKQVAKALAVAALTGATALQAALLGLTPADPTLDFGASGVISYNATTQVVTISGTPSTLFRNDPFLFGTVMGTGVDDEKLITVQFKVDSAGAFISGVTGPDLIIKGSVDTDFDNVPDYDGVLLEAEVVQFGFQEGGTADDTFDLRLTVTGGALAPLYSGQELAMRVISEISSEYPNAFNGSFSAAFSGLAKGVIGSTTPVVVGTCKVDVEAYCSLGNDPKKSSCRIDTAKSPKHWDYEDRYTHSGHTYKRFAYGMHGQPMPSWGNRVKTTDVKFTYVLKNTGTTTVTGIVLDDSFDSPVLGVPTTLAPNQTVTLTRTEKLSDALQNTVLFSALYGSATCTDTDTVSVKEKLRDRRRHDDDKYKDKDDDKDRR